MKTINADLLLEILQTEREHCCVADQPGMNLAIEILKEQEPVAVPSRLVMSLEFDDEKMKDICRQAVAAFLTEHPEVLGGDNGE